jgi:hypothetical protein
MRRANFGRVRTGDPLPIALTDRDGPRLGPATDGANAGGLDLSGARGDGQQDDRRRHPAQAPLQMRSLRSHDPPP